MSDFPDPTPEYTWWSLGWNQRLTTSRCIGKDTSPLCVVETALACKARNKIDLCRAARKDPAYWDESFDTHPGIPYPQTGLMVYHIDTVVRLDESTIPGFIRGGDYMVGDPPPFKYQPGDVAIFVDWLMCGKAKGGKISDCCREDSTESLFITRKVAQGWVLLWKNHPTIGTFYEFPASPDNRKTIFGKSLPRLPVCETINVKAARPGPAIRNYRQWLIRRDNM